MQGKQLPPLNKFFVQLTVVLILVGILSIASAAWFESIRYTGSAWTFLIKHLYAVAIGVPLMFFVSFIHYRWWLKIIWPLMIACLVLLILTATTQFGVVTGGSRRWLAVAGFQFQVSEFIKIFAVMLIAKAFTEKKKVLLSMGLVSLMSFLVLKQPDLGTTMLIISSIIFVAYARGFNLIILFGGLGSLGYLVWQQVLKTPYQMERIQYWLNPYLEPLGRGYNLIQAQYAIGSGGLFGLGWGASQQKQGYLPIAHADFIFSILCEELGLLGITALLVLFIAWIMVALRISFASQDVFAKCLGLGLTGIFAMQTVINICVATGLFPTTGMTLPFISFGGSSFLSCCLLTGVLFNISRFANPASERLCQPSQTI